MSYALTVYCICVLDVCLMPSHPGGGGDRRLSKSLSHHPVQEYESDSEAEGRSLSVANVVQHSMARSGTSRKENHEVGLVAEANDPVVAPASTPPADESDTATDV